MLNYKKTVKKNQLSVRQLDSMEWSEAAKDFTDFNYIQSRSFGNASAERVRAKSEFVGIFFEECLVGLAHVRIKKVPILPMGIAYINGGPVVMKNSKLVDGERGFSLCVKALKAEYVKKRNLVLRIKCPIYAEPENIMRSTLLGSEGFRHPRRPDYYRTFLVDIAKDQEAVRLGLHSKWRNQLNVAMRNELQVVSGTGDDFFDHFSHIFDELRRKKNFDVALDLEFYRTVHKKLQSTEKFVFHFVVKGDRILAGHLGCYVGDTAIYLLGASSDEGNVLKASYMLQWSAILYAQKMNCKYYDLGGIDPDGNKGVYHFKKGFKGLDVTAAGPFEYGSLFSIKFIESLERLRSFIKGKLR